MIDRSYLPFQSAREYQDTGMQKWLGFFLSEHTTALVDDATSVTFLSNLSLEKKLLLVSKSHIIIKTNQGHINVSLDDMLSIELVEEVLDESA